MTDKTEASGVRFVVIAQHDSSSDPGQDWREIREEFMSDGADLTDLKSFMGRLRWERQRRGLTQKMMAKRMDVSQSRVSAIETGDPAKAEVGTLVKYLDALGLRLSMGVEPGC